MPKPASYFDLVLFVQRFFIPLIVGITAFKSKGVGGGLADIITLVSPTFFFADLSLICLLYAFGASRPNSGKSFRFFYHNSRYMIFLSIILYSLILSSLRDFEISNFSLLDWIVTALNVSVVTYVFSSELIKGTFAEFPEFVASDKPT